MAADLPRPPWWLFRLRRLFRARTLPLDGLSLDGYGSGMPKGMVHQIARGDYEAPERAAVKAILRPGDRVVEIGACVGIVSLTAARIVGADNVFAYEPNPSAAKVARGNFARNGLAVSLETAAVGPRSGTAELMVGEGSWLGAHIGGSSQDATPIAVEIRSVADVVAQRRPTVLVMDAEGMEAEILPACPMEGLRALVVEFHETPGQPERMAALRALLAERGFSRDDALSTFSAQVSTEAWRR